MQKTAIYVLYVCAHAKLKVKKPQSSLRSLIRISDTCMVVETIKRLIVFFLNINMNTAAKIKTYNYLVPGKKISSVTGQYIRFWSSDTTWMKILNKTCKVTVYTIHYVCLNTTSWKTGRKNEYISNYPCISEHETDIQKNHNNSFNQIKLITVKKTLIILLM